MKVYHTTTAKKASKIRTCGFRDSTGNYLVFNDYSGVWVSDSPTTQRADGRDEVSFEVEIDEALIGEYELTDEGTPYRQWLVPAEILNSQTRTEIAFQADHPQRRRVAQAGARFRWSLLS